MTAKAIKNPSVNQPLVDTNTGKVDSAWLGFMRDLAAKVDALSKTALTSFPPILSSAPSTTGLAEGYIYYDTHEHALKLWNGTGWAVWTYVP